MRPSAAHAPGLPSKVQGRIERLSRRQRKAVGEPGLRGVRRRRQRLEDDDVVEDE